MKIFISIEFDYVQLDGPIQAPGQPGNVLLDGHRDYRDIDGNVGTGVAWLLPNVAVGDAVIVRDFAAAMYYVYEVRESVAVPWDDPNGVVYLKPSESAILTLITCEGSFDRDTHNYADRRIVVAELTDVIPFGTA